jgi:hypothetical protein
VSEPDEGFSDPAASEDDGFGMAVDAFRDALSRVFGSPEAERDVIDRYEAYARVFREALQSPSVSRMAAQQFEPYARAVAEVFANDDARNELETAFRDYLRALRDAWREVDPADLDATDLASIAEEMSWVAGVVAAMDRTRDVGDARDPGA